MPTASRREITIAILWSLFIMLATCMPYVEGVRLAHGRYFSGLISAVDDGNAYLSWIRQASEGRLTLTNQYTAQPQRPLSVNVFLLALGRTAGALNLTPVQVFHAARFVSGVLCLVSFFLLVCALAPDPAVRWTSLLLASLSSGVGWYFDMTHPTSLPAIHPIDYGPRWVYQPEAITFLSLLLNPLFCFSMALICLSLLCALRGQESGRIRWALGGGLLMLVLGNAHTYDLPLVYLVLVAWGAMGLIARRFPWQRVLLHLAVMVALSAPALLWQYHVLSSDAVYRAKADTPTQSGPYLNFICGYGIVWFLALAGAVWVLATKGPERARFGYVVAWAIVGSAVLYAPVAFQRKLAEGLHFPLCILAAVAVAKVIGGWIARHAPAGRPVKRRLVFLAFAVVLLSLPSNVLFYADCFRAVRTNNADLAGALMPPIYLEAREMAAIHELAARTGDRDVVMASSMVGNYLPAHARCHVVAGHWAESVYLVPGVGGRLEVAPFATYALPAVMGFYSVRTGLADKAGILLRFGVSYVFCGPQERDLYAASASQLPSTRAEPIDADAEFGRLPFLRRIYSRDGVSLFKVAPPDVLATACLAGLRSSAQAGGSAP